MMNILAEIVESTKQRVKQEKAVQSIEELKEIIDKQDLSSNNKFYEALNTTKLSIICEIKKASPSKGIFCDDFDYLKIAQEFENAGANALSIITEPNFFKGSNQILIDVAKQTNLPMLRKDFIIDEYMIYQAKAFGASAILLICAILDDKTLNEYIELAYQLGMDVLVETHNKIEIERALKTKARIIGINNRDLKDFSTKISVSEELAKLIPNNRIIVSESGISTNNDIQRLVANNINSVLIGEACIKSNNINNFIKELKQ